MSNDTLMENEASGNEAEQVDAKTGRRIIRVARGVTTMLPTVPWLERTHQLFVEFSSDLLLDLDRSGKILRASNATPRYFGLNPADVVGRQINDLTRDEDREKLAVYLGSGGSENGTAPLTLSFVHLKNKITEVELCLLPVREGNNEQTGWTAIARRRDAAGRTAEAVISEEAKIAAGLAHELNQPITAMGTTARACVRILRGEEIDVDEILEAVEQISRQSERATEIIKRMRDLMVQGRRYRSPVDLNELIRETVEPFENELRNSKMRVRLEFAPDLPNVVIEQAQVKQVIANLVRNAMEAMYDTTLSQRLITVSTHCDKAEVTVAITDRGSGLAANMVGRLFEPFSTTKPQGMGIGLALSRNFIQAQGGRIWAKPNSDRGMTFFFSLPLIQETL